MLLSDCTTPSSSSTESTLIVTDTAAISSGTQSKRLLTGSAIGDFILGVSLPFLAVFFAARLFNHDD